MITVLVESGQLIERAVIALAPEEQHHLRVRRARSGDPIVLLDGQGTIGEGTLQADGKVEIRTRRQVPEPPSLVLAVGAGDRQRFGWVVEKAAELDVTEVIPLETERTAGVGTRVQARDAERLQRRATEALKQSGAAWAPRIQVPRTPAELVAKHASGIRWLADRRGGLPRLEKAESNGITIVVGPEGGWTDAEHALLVGAGFLPVRFGVHTLRFETAALAGAVMAGLLRRRDE